MNCVKRPGILLLFLSLFFMSGCGSENTESLKVDKIKIISGDAQCGLGGNESKELKVELLSPSQKGLLGGKGSPLPIQNSPVKFEIEPKLEDGIKLLTPAEAKTDVGGFATARVTFGNCVADQYLVVTSLDNPEKTARMRITSGVKRIGDKMEVKAGGTSEEVGVVVANAEGKPLAGVPVYFTIKDKPGSKNKAKLKVNETMTDADGRAVTFLSADKSATGTYEILAEVGAGKSSFAVRGVVIKVMAFNGSGLLLNVVGGLALFIFGMKLMTDGLQQVAGNKLKTILGYFARNRFVAVLTGALVTGFIQSSSACTVMVVGFVNAGLLALEQAIGVIFGANIGTTITAQMISFKLNNLAMPAIIIGVVALVFIKRASGKGWATVILGFGLLFFGMTVMSSELKGLRVFPTFVEYFKTFDCTPDANGFMPFSHVLGAIFIGTVMTVLIQSSSATIGLTIALASSGLINFYTAMPLILGDNIGTTITAILASLGGNRRSKQAAIAHSTFNIIGAAYMTILFYIPYEGKPIYLYFIDQITEGNVFAAEPVNISRHIAMGHTLFNVFNVIIMLPFLGCYVWLCNKIIPLRDSDREEPNLLDAAFLATPPLALQQSVEQIKIMTQKSWVLLADAITIVKTGDFAKEQLIHDEEEKIDVMQRDITNYLTELTKQTLTDEETLAVPLLMHCTNNAERMSDNAEKIVSLARRLDKEQFTDAQKNEIRQIFTVMTEKMDIITKVFAGYKAISKKEMVKIDFDLKQMLKKFEEEDIETIEQGRDSANRAVVFIEVINTLGTLNGRLTNIWERINKLRKMEVIDKQTASN